MRNHLKILAAAAALVTLPTTLLAYNPSVEVGMLSCALAGNQGTTGAVTMGKALDVVCEFRLGRSGASETYVGTLQYVGQIKEVFNDGTALLVVKAPASTKPVAGMLQQKYGAERAAQGTAQVPLGGETNSSVVLQPLKEKFDQPTMALGGPAAGSIIAVELELKASPA